MKLLRLFVATLCLGLVPVLAHGSACTTTNLAALSGASCSIGSITFNFGAASGFIQTEAALDQQGNGIFTQVNLSPSNITFTPFVHGNVQGFTLSGVPAVSAPLGYNFFSQVFSVVNMNFSANVSSGLITGSRVSVTGTAMASNNNPGVVGTEATNQADFEAFQNQNLFLLSHAFNDITCFQGCTSTITGIAPFDAVNLASITNADIFIQQLAVYESLDGSFFIFNDAESASGTVGTFEFQTSASAPAVPEPSTLVFLSTGLLSAAGSLLRRRRS